MPAPRFSSRVSSRVLALPLGFAALVLGLVVGPASARADEAPAAPAAEPDVAVHETDKSHAVFARTDIGREGWDVGVGYMHLWRQADSYHGLGGMTWMGIGGDTRIFAAREPGRVSGAGGFATGRISFLGDTMGMSIEAAVGAADLEGRPRAIATAGAGMSFLYADLGYSYQLPIDGGDRAGVIASHMFTLRITIPVRSYDRSVKTTPMTRASAASH